MIRWVVIFSDTEGMLDIRNDRGLRDAHIRYATDNPTLLIGGGLKRDPEQQFCGAMWVVEADTRDEVINLIENDPFYVPEHRSFEIFTWGKILENETVNL